MIYDVLTNGSWPNKDTINIETIATAANFGKHSDTEE